jgi:hypothetical protein
VARRINYRLFVVLGLILVSGCTSIERLALPEPDLADAYWERHDAASTAVIDHEPWQAFLDRHVSTDAAGVNRVAYGAVDAGDQAALKRYLADLEAVPIHQYRRAEQLAYWVNLYNAKTVDIVLDHYPVDSIRDIKLGDDLIVVGPWGAPVLRVSGRSLSLNDIEHRIIRPVWQDQRIHYVLNCAAVGCPNLGLEAYTGDTIDLAMTAAATAYVNDPRGVHVDDRDRLHLSKIYAWFREDFGGEPPAVLRSVARFATPPLRARLEGRKRIDRYTYDWSLNDGGSVRAPLTARRQLAPRDHVRQDVSLASDLSVASAASPPGRRDRQR